MKNRNVMANLPHHIYGGHVGFRFAVVDGSISLSYLRSFSVENVGLDTATKSLDSLIRKIFSPN